MNNEINDFMKNHVYNICNFSERKMQAYTGKETNPEVMAVWMLLQGFYKQ